MMNEELLKLMKPEFEAAKEAALKEGRAEGHAKGRIETYHECGLTIAQIAEKMQMPQSKIKEILGTPA